jgi:hypothetical protein
MSILKDLFTGIDGESQDIGRWSWALCTFAVIGAAFANWWHNAAIDLVSFGTALCAVVTAHGAAIFLKRDTEPK